MLILSLVILATCTTAGASYNRDAAVKYALKYAKNPNPDYTYFSKDCTNFVSQCLTAGGWTRVGNNYQSVNSWYYNSGRLGDYSLTWTVADSLYRFLKAHPDRAQLGSLSNRPWYKQFKPGDIIQLDYGNNGYVDHSMIVTSVSNNDMIVTYHTTNTPAKSLNKIVMENPGTKFIGWKIK